MSSNGDVRRVLKGKKKKERRVRGSVISKVEESAGGKEGDCEVGKENRMLTLFNGTAVFPRRENQTTDSFG